MSLAVLAEVETSAARLSGGMEAITLPVASMDFSIVMRSPLRYMTENMGIAGNQLHFLVEPGPQLAEYAFDGLG